MTPLETLRHHVSGAIERGEKSPIVEQRPVTLTLIFKTRDGDITQRATADKPRKAFAAAFDGLERRYPKESWRGVDYARAAYNAFAMALNVPHGTACGTPYTVVYIDPV